VELLYEALTCQKDFVIIPDTEHTFTQKKSLEEIERVMREWVKNK
jgi:predicted RNase H-like HicB family nuclease